eukprot:6182844-Pleurochrysis_carterae.AAC.1
MHVMSLLRRPMQSNCLRTTWHMQNQVTTSWPMRSASKVMRSTSSGNGSTFRVLPTTKLAGQRYSQSLLITKNRSYIPEFCMQHLELFCGQTLFC